MNTGTRNTSDQPTIGLTREEFDAKLAEANRLMAEGYDLDSVFNHTAAAERFDRSEAILDALEAAPCR